MHKMTSSLLTAFYQSHLFPKIGKRTDKLSTLEALIHVLYHASINLDGHYFLTIGELAHICNIDTTEAREYIMNISVTNSFDNLGFEIDIDTCLVNGKIDVRTTGEFDE